MAKTPTSTAVAPRKANAGSVVSIQEQLRAQAEAVADRISPPSGHNIRLSKEKGFSLPDGSVDPGPLDFVIVDFVSTNSFYPEPFNERDPKPPSCFAVGPDPKKLVPAAQSPDLQAKSCAECPMNQWGSGPNGGKACKNERKLAVLPPGADADTPLAVLKVSPTGLKSFDGYVSSVARTFQMPPVAVVTEVALNDQLKYTSLVFGNPRPNSDDLAQHFARQTEARELLMTIPDMSTHAAPPAKAVKAVRRR